MKRLFKKGIAFIIVSAMIVSLFPVSLSAYSFTGQDYNVTSNITLFGQDTGADYTRVHLGSGGSSGWGANRYINIVEANLSKHENLGLEVINHGSSTGSATPLTSEVANYSEDNNTILAAVNGDWMSYAKSIGVPVTKNYRVSFSSMLIDGEIWCSEMSSQEQSADYYTFGVSSDRQVYIGKPYVSTTIKNVSTGKTISATGVNRAPANNGLYVYNNRIGSSNYVPTNAYEVAISTSSNKFMNGGTITGTVKGIYPVGTTSRCGLDDNTIIITARGTKVSTIKGYFSVGQTVNISTKLTASSNSSFWAKCEEAIGGQCLVMRNGSINNDLGASTGENSHQYPTNIIGYKKDGTVMMTMVTSDTNGKYVGLRFNRIASFCKSVGYDTCLLLDGGGSTTMVTLEDGTYVERACYSDGSIRSVWNSIALVNKDSGIVPNSIKSVVFDAMYYSSKHPDLKAAFGSDATKLYNHFINFGIKEGRQASPNFDVKYYVNNNADLKAAFGTDYLAGMKHFAEYGVNEKRLTAKPADIGTNVEFRINVNNLAVGLSGTNVVTATKALNSSEVWIFIKNTDGAYTIKNKETGKVLDVYAASNKAGANVHTYDSNDSDAQRWFMYDCGDGTYILQPKCSTTCVLDIANGATVAGANIQIYTSNGSAAQKYSLASISKVENLVANSQYVDLGNNFYAHITGVGSGKNISDSNASVVLANNAVTASQIWKFEKYSDGSYKIINQASGKVLDVAGGKDASGTKVQTYTSNDSNAQRWFVYNTSNGYVFLPKSSTTSVLDVVAGGTTAGTSLQIYTFNDTAAQKFTVTKLNGSDYMEIVGSTSIGTGFYANISIGSTSVGISGTNVQLVKTSKTSASQTWKFDLQSDGSYKITNKSTGKVLDVYAAQDANFANVQIYESNDTKAQRWYLYEKDGKYILRSAASDTRVLDVYAGNIAAGTNVDIYTRNYTDAQMFTITKV